MVAHRHLIQLNSAGKAPRVEDAGSVVGKLEAAHEFQVGAFNSPRIDPGEASFRGALHHESAKGGEL